MPTNQSDTPVPGPADASIVFGMAIGVITQATAKDHDWVIELIRMFPPTELNKIRDSANVLLEAVGA